MRVELSSPQYRLHQSIEQRFHAASTELRTMSLAMVADREPPDFRLGDTQKTAIHSFLCACRDAHAAVFGTSDDGAFDADWEAHELNPETRRWINSDRLLAVDQAIGAGGRAARLLRQSGLKPAVDTSMGRDAATGQMTLVRADLRFCLRTIRRGTAP